MAGSHYQHPRPGKAERRAEEGVEHAAPAKVTVSLFLPENQTGTGVTYTGQGQKMDVDQAKAKGLCFRCGKSGHMARNCPDKPKFQVRALTAELTKEEKEELAKTLREEGFSGT